MAGRRGPSTLGGEAGLRRGSEGGALGFLSGRTSPTPESHNAGAQPGREDVGLSQDLHFVPGPGVGRNRKACPVAVFGYRGPARHSTKGLGLSRLARGHNTPHYDGPSASGSQRAVIGAPAVLHAGFSVL